MRGLVKEAKRDVRIRLFAGNLVAGIRGKAFRAEIARCFDYVKDNIEYRQDIRDVETIQTPNATIELGYGDCDDMCVLLCSLLEAIGHSTRFMAVGFNFENLDEFEHVFVQVQIPDRDGRNEWVSLDPTEKRAMGWEPSGYANWILVYN